MRDGVTLQMTYHSFWKENQATFEFAPYFVKVFKQRWYVIGESDRLKVYALDRIKALETTAKPFELPKEIDPQAYFYSCYGIINDETIKPQAVVIKVNSDQAHYLRALSLHPSQQEVEKNESYSIFQYYIKPLFDFRQELLSHGEDVEVISPDWFRDEIRNSVAAMRKLYSKKPFPF
jgi:predicted DNA-binding transcriptional regulator YafY